MIEATHLGQIMHLFRRLHKKQNYSVLIAIKYRRPGVGLYDLPLKHCILLVSRSALSLRLAELLLLAPELARPETPLSLKLPSSCSTCAG